MQVKTFPAKEWNQAHSNRDPSRKRSKRYKDYCAKHRASSNNLVYSEYATVGIPNDKVLPIYRHKIHLFPNYPIIRYYTAYTIIKGIKSVGVVTNVKNSLGSFCVWYV
jgi:hypothetical protein